MSASLALPQCVVTVPVSDRVRVCVSVIVCACDFGITCVFSASPSSYDCIGVGVAVHVCFGVSARACFIGCARISVCAC